MTSSNYFQCLICNSFFGTLWNAEKHLKTHQPNYKEPEERNGQNLRTKSALNGPERRRGMLPIQKVAFTDCYVRVVRIQWPTTPEPGSRKLIEIDNSLPDNPTDVIVTARPKRQARLKADQRITQLSSILKIPKRASEDTELNEHVMKKFTSGSGYYDDDDFQSERPPKRKSTSTAAPKRRRDNPMDSSKAKCEHCLASHSNQRDLSNHIAHNHQDKVNVLICPISTCKVPTLNSYWLGMHFRHHTDAERKELLYSLYTPGERLKSLEKLISTRYYSSNTFYCKFCLSRHESFEMMQSHQAEAHHGFNLKCPCDCGIGGFNGSVTALITHVKLAHPHLINDLTESKFSGHINEGKDATGAHDRTPIPCPVCKKCFSNKTNFQRHFHLHLENNPFVCDIPLCNRKFNSAYNLKRHRALHDAARATSSRYACPKCSVTYAKKEGISKHLKDFHGSTKSARSKPKMRKPKIRAAFIPAYTEEEMKALLEKNKSGSLHSTDIDESVPVLAVPLKQEVNPDPIENSSKIFKVEAEVHFVDRIILQEDGTAEHITGEQLIPDETFSIEESNPEPEYVSNLDSIAQDPVVQNLRKKDPSLSILDLFPRKTRVYNKGKSFTCSECKDVFNRAWTLQLHMTTQHKKTIAEELLSGKCTNGEVGARLDGGGAQTITLMCGTCVYPAKSKEELTSHMKTHEQPQQQWKCLEKRCGLVFATQEMLYNHVDYVHFKNRGFPCKECPKAFITEKGLKTHTNKVHLRKPNGEKITKTCPICQAILAPSTYYGHVKRHKDESEGMVAPRCMLCHDSFSCKMSLQRHIDAVHLGKPVNKNRHAAAAARRKAVTSKKAAESIYPLLQNGCEYKDINEPEMSPRDQEIEQNDMEAGRSGSAGEILGF